MFTKKYSGPAKTAGTRRVRPASVLLLGVTSVALVVATTACSGPPGPTASANAKASTSSALNCGGCGDGKTIHVLLSDWGTAAASVTNAQTKWEQEVAARFKAATGATVSYSTYEGATGELTAIETGSVSQSGPDVMQVGSSLVGTAKAANIFDQISTADWALIGGKSQFYQPAVSNNFTAGVTIPQYQSPSLLVYNTELFKEAGIKAPPTTWTQYVDDAKKITNLGNGIYGAGIAPTDPYDPWHEVFFLTSDMGDGLVNKAGTKGTMTSTVVQKAVEFYLGLYNQYHVAPSASWTLSQVTSSFADGKIGMVFAGGSIGSAVSGKAASGNVAYAKMPTIPYGENSMPEGATPAAILGYTWNLGVTSWSSDKSLAYRYLRVAADTESQVALGKYYGVIPSTTAALNQFKSSEKIGPYVRLMLGKDAGVVGAPPAAYWGTVETALSTATTALSRDIQNGTYNAAAVKAALARANDQINAAIGQTSK